MYASNSVKAPSSSDKNPNRVLGGLKGAGVNSFTMLGEDGMEKQIPTTAYVHALEEKLKVQEQRIIALEKQYRRINNDQKMDRTAFSNAVKR